MFYDSHEDENKMEQMCSYYIININLPTTWICITVILSIHSNLIIIFENEGNAVLCSLDGQPGELSVCHRLCSHHEYQREPAFFRLP